MEDFIDGEPRLDTSEVESGTNATDGSLERTIEMAGFASDISCVFVGDKVVRRVKDSYRRPEGLVEVLGHMLGVMPLVSDGKMDVDCPRLRVNRCVSCPKNARSGPQASPGVDLGLDPMEAYRMTEGNWNPGAVE